MGRYATVGATIVAIGTALIASNFANLMDYLQTLFGFFNAPLFATFILGMFWKRMTPTAGWVGLVFGTLSAVAVFVMNETGVFTLPGQGAAFLAAAAAFAVDIILSIVVTQFTAPKPDKELVGFVYSLTPKEARTDPDEKDYPWYRRPVPLAGVALVMVIVLNVIFA
jgi:SSS family solute:Na+ symporter